MKLGFSELLIIFLIFLVLCGPQVYGFAHRWLRRGNAAVQQKKRRLRQQAEAAARETNAALTRLWVTAYAAAALALVGGLGWLFLHQPAAPPEKWIPAEATTALAQTGSLNTAEEIPLPARPLCARQQGDWLFFAAEGGQLWRVLPDGTAPSLLWETAGEITSFDFAADGSLLLACTDYGGSGALVRLTYADWGATPELLQPAEGILAVAAGADGTIYYTQAGPYAAKETSAADAVTMNLLAHNTAGGVYAYRPGGQEPVLVASGLCLPTGLALSEESRCLYVSDAATGTVWQLPADAEGVAVGSRSTIALLRVAARPGALTVGADGRLWVAILSDFNWVEKAAGQPLLRRAAMNLPARLRRRLVWGGTSALLAYDCTAKAVREYWPGEGLSPIPQGAETAAAVYVAGQKAKLLRCAY